MATSAIKIIRNAPPPPTLSGARYPFADMSVGDAFDAPVTARTSISTIAAMRKRTKGEGYTIRKIDAETVRVWRIA